MSRSMRLGLAKDPRVCSIKCYSQQRNVIASEPRRLFPKVAVAKEASDGDRVPQSVTGTFSPDSDFDQSTANLMGRLTDHQMAPCCAGCIRASASLALRGGWKKWPAGETSRPKTNTENLLKTYLSQYSNGSRMVVTERSHSVMIQNRMPLLVRASFSRASSFRSQSSLQTSPQSPRHDATSSPALLLREDRLTRLG